MIGSVTALMKREPSAKDKMLLYKELPENDCHNRRAQENELFYNQRYKKERRLLSGLAAVE